ncbi:hypothetical protein BH11MYX1_BH11MYX1_14120 [soil metagenome]
MKRLMFASLLVGCGAPAPVATVADARRAHVELAELSDGRALLFAKCGGCHDVPTPDQKSRTDWPRQVADMQDRAGLDSSQRALIEQYLVVMTPK